MSQALARLTGSVELFRRTPETASELTCELGTVTPEHTNRQVMDMFNADPSLTGLVVVEDERPLGLIHRNAFYGRFAKPWSRELYLKTKCTDSMNPDTIRVESETSTAELGQIVGERGESALAEGFIVTNQGRFAGLCSGITLLRALSDLQAEQHRSLLSSIDYASAIQSALLAGSREALSAAFPGERHGLVWKPRDGVGGDCFFAAEAADGLLVGVIDCTGHGVPGALLTMIAVSETARLAADPELNARPGLLLDNLNRRVKAALQQHEASHLANHDADDGMDAAFVWIERSRARMRLASAKLPVMLQTDGGAIETLKGDRKGVGYRDTANDFRWTEHEIETAGRRRLVLATDGVSDQIGQEKPIAFGWARVRQALQAGAELSAGGQVRGLWDAFEAYRGREARRDDVTMLTLDLGAGA